MHVDVGRCANGGRALDPTARPSLLYSASCRADAKEVRYFRRCKREVRFRDPDAQQALKIRFALLIGGGCPARERQLPAAVRAAVLADNAGRCGWLNDAPATEVDHVSGSASDRSNLQGLRGDCHRAKTSESLVPLSVEGKAKAPEFSRIVDAAEPLRTAHDHPHWESAWRNRLADTKEWAASMREQAEAGYLGDGSTGTIEDRVQAAYFAHVMERD